MLGFKALRFLVIVLPNILKSLLHWVQMKHKTAYILHTWREWETSLFCVFHHLSTSLSLSAFFTKVTVQVIFHACLHQVLCCLCLCCSIHIIGGLGTEHEHIHQSLFPFFCGGSLSEISLATSGLASTMLKTFSMLLTLLRTSSMFLFTLSSVERFIYINAGDVSSFDNWWYRGSSTSATVRNIMGSISVSRCSR